MFCKTYPRTDPCLGLLNKTAGTYTDATNNASEKLHIATHIRVVANSTDAITKTNNVFLYFTILYETEHIHIQ